MKKIFIGLLTLLAVTCCAWANGSPWSLDLGPGASLPVQNWQSAYTAGFGGRLGLGYQLDPSWAVELDADTFNFSGQNFAGNISDTEIRLMPVLKYYLSDQVLQPYLLAGAGVDLVFYSSSLGTTSGSYFDSAFGAGVAWALNAQTSLYVESRYHLAFANGLTLTDIPLLAGIHFGL